MTIWEDQGLYFTLIFNSIVVAVVLIVGFVMHKAQTNARALRPNRPGSQTATLYSLPSYIATIDEQVVLQSNGVQPYMYIMTLKFMTFLFAGMCITSVVIVSMCATDDQLNRFNASNDPDECYPKSKGSCDDAPRCSWDSLAPRCVPLIRHGLFDLSAANLGEGDASWRLYLFAIFSVACCIPLFIALRAFATAMRDTIEHANTRPAFSGFKYGAMATVGARTVMIAGLPKDAKVLTDPALFHAYLIAEQETRKTLLEDRVEKPKDDDDAEKAKADGPKSTDVPAEPRPNDNSFDVAKPSVPTPKSELAVLASPAERSAEEAGEPFPAAVADLTAPSWVLAAHVALDSICIIRQAPDDLMDLIEAEKEALTLLADAVAAEKLEKDEEKKPVMVRAGCKKVPGIEHRLSELAKVREEMEPKLDERATQDMTGAVMMTFDRASTAFAFVRQFNAEQGVVSFVEAQVVGPRESIIWANLSVVGPVAKVRGVVMIAIFVTLVFFWGIPVGFLGSLSNLETLPGIGSAFASAFAPIPVTVLGTLSAYLPTIVITVFNILLPALFRFFGRLGGLKTTDAETRSVLLMCAVFSIMSGIVMQAALQGGFAQAMALISNPSGDAVRALIIAIVSPSGGYWYVYLLSAACLGLGIRFLDLGPMIGSFILGKLASRQEEYDKLFDPRPTDFAFVTGRHIFFAAIGLLFHGTVAFLQPFATMYSGAAYFVERSLMLDAGCRDKVQMVDYSYVLTGFHCILCLHTVASVGNVIIAALKLSIGAPIIAGVGIFVSLGMHVYVRRVLADTIFLTPERVLAIETQAEAEGLKQQARSDSKPYAPDYATHTIDRGAVDRIQALEFPEVDKSWPKTANSPEAVEVVVA